MRGGHHTTSGRPVSWDELSHASHATPGVTSMPIPPLAVSQPNPVQKKLLFNSLETPQQPLSLQAPSPLLRWQACSETGSLCNEHPLWRHACSQFRHRRCIIVAFQRPSREAQQMDRIGAACSNASATATVWTLDSALPAALENRQDRDRLTPPSRMNVRLQALKKVCSLAASVGLFRQAATAVDRKGRGCVSGARHMAADPQPTSIDDSGAIDQSIL